MDNQKLGNISKLVRYYILQMTTRAGSGHMTSSMSAVEIMVALYFTKLRFDLKNPKSLLNDRVVFSKGHATPLFYALYGVAGVLSEKELLTYRTFKSKLEGHPRPVFPYADVATGSLGQGLSMGLGMAMAMGSDSSDKGRAFYEETAQTRAGLLQSTAISHKPNVYVLMGDSEVAEGSVWEAAEIASYYSVDNLTAIVDVNRLGQRGPTMLGWDIEKYRARFEAFGWEVHEVDGHDLEAIVRVFDQLPTGSGRPQVILAKTIKGKGVPFAEDKEGWHAKVLMEDELKEAIFALGDINKKIKAEIAKPGDKGQAFYEETAQTRAGLMQSMGSNSALVLDYKIGDQVATRKAYGEALAQLGETNPEVVSLDGEVKNSTFAEIFEAKYPNRFLEMYIAEQNMVGVAIGMAKLGKIPFVSTFSAFMTRAHDQIRMASYSEANIKFVGSHAGVSIGADGPSQMGLEDVALFRTIFGSHVFVPADAVSCARLLEVALREEGIFYIRTLRPDTQVIYEASEEFSAGGSKVLRVSKKDKVTVVASGITVFEAIKAHDELKKKGVDICVIDAYSIKPIDKKTIIKCAQESGELIITVEDHFLEGGLGDAVLEAVSLEKNVTVYKMGVFRVPLAGKPDENLKYQEIDSSAIVGKVLEIIK